VGRVGARAHARRGCGDGGEGGKMALRIPDRMAVLDQACRSAGDSLPGGRRELQTKLRKLRSGLLKRAGANCVV